MYYHHKNHNILMIIICALRGTTNFTQALNGGHGQTQQTSPLIYLKIQVGGLYSAWEESTTLHVGYSTLFFLQLQNQFTNLAILPLPQLGYIFEWSFSALIWRFSVQSLLDRFHYDSSTKTYFWGKCKSNCLCTTCFNLQPFRVHIVERR